MSDSSTAEPHDRADSGDDSEPHANRIVTKYLLKNCNEFLQLSEIRRKGWDSKAGDEFFRQQRRQADKSDEKTAQYFYNMMQRIGHELQNSTRCFTIRTPKNHQRRILDFCAAPGGFLKVALKTNPIAKAMAFSLPSANGGHRFLLPEDPSIAVKDADITMFAADMGVHDIPSDHPDVENFLPKQFAADDLFDLILCGGQVLRTHERASYRERREPLRLSTVQLSLGLEHVKQGGSMVILMHRVEAWPTVQLLYSFSKFSTIRLYKSAKAHVKRSSFYLLATEIRKEHPEARLLIEYYRKIWQIVTVGTDDDYESIVRDRNLEVHEVMEQFGTTLVELGRDIWRIQSIALENASFNKGETRSIAGTFCR